ncbi:MAG: type 1 glutamine amidotransferase [Thiobacillaceae bacterium]|nr:type 1 glutamine amidotransferase [Thiobacillaceae bacterium]MCX7673533.1 type 1 glutamine amidotransferase [Thiobacillaceae bacterium]MDW8324251.1 type 1 glutamine amidotransferase [Burkholderiales bacterium]
MKPVAIFRHAPTEGPGYFATVLDRRGLPWRLIAIDAGEPVPADPTAFAGLAFMGGPMSVNDDLPWIPPVLALIRAAMARDIPVLGHCLGGQLMAKALGAAVTRNPVKEIGWGEVQVLDNPQARAWFGDVERFHAFHWHGETFAIPAGATHVLRSAHCVNQAFVLGKHLALQCHVEMTEEMIRTWCEVGAEEIEQAGGPAVQSPAAMCAELPARLAPMQAVAERLYARWIEGLAA